MLPPPPASAALLPPLPPPPPSAARVRKQHHMGASAELTPAETSFLLRSRLIKMLWEGAFGMGSAALNIKLMLLANNDTALLAAAHATHWSLTSIGKVLLSPVYGAASDTLGRRWLWALGRLSMVVQFAGWWGARSVSGFVFWQCIAWGVLPLDGSMKVEDASWADMFGDRPDLSSKLQAQNQVSYHDIRLSYRPSAPCTHQYPA